MARGAIKIVLDVGGDGIFCPIGEGADTGFRAGELGDEGVLGVDGLGQMLDEQVEELGTGGLGRAFDDGTEGVELGVGCDGGRRVGWRIGHGNWLGGDGILKLYSG